MKNHDSELTEAKQKHDAFKCWACRQSLIGQRYVSVSDHPCCLQCYNSLYTNTCVSCNTKIDVYSKVTKKINSSF